MAEDPHPPASRMGENGDSVGSPGGSSPAGRVGEPDSLGGLSKGVRQGAVWAIATMTTVKLGSLIVTAVMARLLAPADFGVFAVAATVFALLGAFTHMGTVAAVARADLKLDAIAPTVTTIAVLSSVIVATIMALAAEYFAELLGTPDAADPIRVLALGVALGSPFMVAVAQLVRDFEQRKTFVATLAGFIPANVLMVLLALNGSGAMAFAWSRVVSQFVAGVVSLLMVKKRYRPGLDRNWLAPLLTFGIPLSGAALVANLNLNVDYVLISRLLTPADVGLYLLAFNVSGWSAALTTAAVKAVIVPAISRVRGDPTLLREAIHSAVRLVGTVAMPIAGLTWALAEPLVLTLYGSRFVGAAPALVVLSGFGILFAFGMLFTNIFIGIGRTGILLRVQLAAMLALVPTMILGIRWFGIVGAALAQTVVICAITIPAYVIFLSRWTGFTVGQLWRAAAPPAAAASLASLAAFIASAVPNEPAMQLVLGGLVGGLVWLPLTGSTLSTAIPPLRDNAGFRKVSRSGECLERILTGGR